MTSQPVSDKRRVLVHRIMSGTLIVSLLILAANHMPALGGWLLLVTICALAQLEFYRLLNLPGIPVFRWLGVLVGAGMVTATYFTMGLSPEQSADALTWEHFVLCLGMIAVFFSQFPQRNNTQPLATIACTLLGILYVPYLFNYFTRLVYTWEYGPHDMRVSDTGRQLVFYLVLVVKSTDVGAFFVGSAIGKHKLFPRLSPRKTWEGFAGGLACALIASITYVHVADGAFGVLQVSMLSSRSSSAPPARRTPALWCPGWAAYWTCWTACCLARPHSTSMPGLSCHEKCRGVGQYGVDRREYAARDAGVAGPVPPRGPGRTS